MQSAVYQGGRDVAAKQPQGRGQQRGTFRDVQESPSKQEKPFQADGTAYTKAQGEVQTQRFQKHARSQLSLEMMQSDLRPHQEGLAASVSVCIRTGKLS